MAFMVMKIECWELFEQFYLHIDHKTTTAMQGTTTSKMWCLYTNVY